MSRSVSFRLKYFLTQSKTHNGFASEYREKEANNKHETFDLAVFYRMLSKRTESNGGQVGNDDGGPMRNLQVQQRTSHLREASLSDTQLSCLEDRRGTWGMLPTLSRWKKLHNFHYSRWISRLCSEKKWSVSKITILELSA